MWADGRGGTDSRGTDYSFGLHAFGSLAPPHYLLSYLGLQPGVHSMGEGTREAGMRKSLKALDLSVLLCKMDLHMCCQRFTVDDEGLAW